MRIETGSEAWLEITRYAQQRIAELTETALTPSAPERDRLEAAIRADELRLLLAEPGEAARRALARAGDEARNTY